MDAVPLGEKMKGLLDPLGDGRNGDISLLYCTCSEIDPFVVRHPQHEGLITELLAELIGFVTLR